MSAAAAEVVAAARVLAEAGLVDAFGHVSTRAGGETCLITPARPLGELSSEPQLVELALGATELPPGTPKEAWIHLAIYRARADVGGICRAQPEAVNAAVAAGVELRPRHGQGAFLGSRVPVYDDARLVREPALGAAAAAALGDAGGLVLRGNGAVAVGATPGRATARMHVMEASARINLAAAAHPSGRFLSPAEVDYWSAAAPELLDRLWEHLATSVGSGS